MTWDIIEKTFHGDKIFAIDIKGLEYDPWEIEEEQLKEIIRETANEHERSLRLDENEEQREYYDDSLKKFIDCWQKYRAKNEKQLSPKTIAELLSLKKEEAPDAPIESYIEQIANETLNKAKIIAVYENGMNGNMQPPTYDNIIQILDNMQNIIDRCNTNDRQNTGM